MISFMLWQDFRVIGKLSVPWSKLSRYRDAPAHKALTENHSISNYLQDNADNREKGGRNICKLDKRGDIMECDLLHQSQQIMQSSQTLG